ncbi:putative ABC transporter ATP-binding protein YufO [Streptomyces afghaniensis 772]|uniref:Putative ABC transporter ATP-binding protein YufO n=1 Tax=Streptomyces afghaniensis 772 TaxID=1283301 RepID=S4N248_9ACTN|nr:putative ABC transporter ATP-binding protein YufO [Streptomyces afghaniensis 772]
MGQAVISSSASRMVPESAARRPMSASTSSVWPLPSTPAMPRTSPAWMVKLMSSRRALPPGAGQAEPVDADDRAVGDRGLGRLGGGQFAADHHLGELARGGLGGDGRADGGAAADDGDLVGDGEHLAELVRDEDDRQALGPQFAQVGEEGVDLLRDEHGGRLVQDEGAGAAVEDLEDLHALAGGDAELLDQEVGLDVEAVALGEFLDLAAGLGADAVQLLAAEHDVLEDREVVGEHEVLVDHADAADDGVGRRREADLLAVDGDGALVRLLHAVEDLHQRRLAGAVLADEGVHGALADAEVDVVVGHDARETLRDPGELDGGHRFLDRRSGRRAAGRVDDALSWGRGPSTRVAPLRHTKGPTHRDNGVRGAASPYPVERT